MAVLKLPQQTNRPLSGMERFRLAVLCFAIIGGTIAYSAQLTSFLYVKEAVIAACACLLGLTAVSEGRLPAGVGRAFWPLALPMVVAALAGISGITRLGTDSALALLRWAVLLLLAATSFDLLYVEAARKKVYAALVVSAAAVALLAVIQYEKLAPFLFPDYGGKAHPLYSVFGNPGLLGGYLAMVLPLALHDYLAGVQFRLVRVLACAIIAFGLMISGTRSAWFAGALGCLFVLATTSGRGRKAAAAFLAIAALAVLAWLVSPELTAGRLLSAVGTHDTGRDLRLWFWAGSLRMFQFHPLFGVGPGNYGYFSPLFLGQVLWQPGGSLLAHNELHTVHAHCDPLELTAEFGLIGVAPLVWWWLRLTRCHGPEWGGLLAFLVFGCFYFPSYSVPHALACLLLGNLLLAKHWRLGEERLGPATLRGPFRLGENWRRPFEKLAPGELRFIAACAAGTAAAATLPLIVWMEIVPSCYLRTAENLHVSGRPALQAYQQAIHCTWAGAEAHEQFGIALLDKGKYERAFGEFVEAVKGSDTGGVYFGLGAAALALGNYQAARDAAEACVFRWPSYAPAWVLLGKATPPAGRAQVLQRARRWVPEASLAIE